MQTHEISTGTEAVRTKAVRCIYRLLCRAMSRARPRLWRENWKAGR